MSTDSAISLSKGEVIRLVNTYVGVSDGYLADFSYRSHAEFYPEFCDVDVSPADYDGTTRERFIAILERAEPSTQARILRGVLRKYPPGSSAARTPQQAELLEALVRRLESGCGVAGSAPSVTSEIVTRAINDAETLLRSTDASSGVDRMHTAFHGFLRSVCDHANIPYCAEASVTVLYKLIRKNHPALKGIGTHEDQVDRILKSFAAAVDALNTLRNHGSVAHPNGELLDREEAYLYINVVRTLMAYIDTKISNAGRTACADSGLS